MSILCLVFIFIKRKYQVMPSDDFVIIIRTDNTGSITDYQFKIPTTRSGYNYNIDHNNNEMDKATEVTENYICDYGIGLYH